MRILAAISAAFLFATPAFADEGWYLRGDIGGTVETELDSANRPDPDEGLALALGGGYQFENGLRADGEIVYLSNDVGPDEATAVIGLATVYYDFNRKGAWRPFVGAGIGFADVEVDGPAGDDDTGFAYQATAGLGYQFTEKLTGELAYRFIAATDVSLDRSGREGDYEAQAITVGLRWRL